MKRKPVAPCMGCKKREVGCHGKCKEYQEYRTDQNEVNQNRYKRNCEERMIKGW